MACQNLCLKNWDKKATIGSCTYLLDSGVVSSIIEVACSINSNTSIVYWLYFSTVFVNCISQQLARYLPASGVVRSTKEVAAAKRQLLIQLSFLSDLPPFNSDVGITVEGEVLEVKNFILQYIHTDTHNYKRYVYKYKWTINTVWTVKGGLLVVKTFTPTGPAFWNGSAQNLME